MPGLQKAPWESEISLSDTLFRSRANFATALNRAWHLCKMHYPKIRIRMVKGVMRERAGNRFWTLHAKVVQIIAINGVRKIEIDNCPGKVGAIASDTVEIILVRQTIKLGDKLLVLLHGRV